MSSHAGCWEAKLPEGQQALSQSQRKSANRENLVQTVSGPCFLKRPLADHQLPNTTAVHFCMYGALPSIVSVSAPRLLTYHINYTFDMSPFDLLYNLYIPVSSCINLFTQGHDFRSDSAEAAWAIGLIS